MDTIREISPAKVNLFLEIVGKRSDGYHEVSTVLQEITLCDRLIFSAQQDGITFSSSLSDPLFHKDNLVVRAAQKIKSYFAVKAGVHIELEKNIPIAAGLGGGSSNAAATLRGLNKLWNLGCHHEQLFLLAKDIGADVPFFLFGGTALCEGRGEEIIQRFKMAKKYWLVLVYPHLKLFTKDVYQAVKFPLTKGTADISLLLLSLHKGHINTLSLYNRLEDIVLKKYPILAKMKDDLLTYGARASLITGSGSALFAIAHTEINATIIQNRFMEKYKRECSSFIVNTVTSLREEANKWR
ncbi:4-(cytidine 5'-diphospho)-2-C-methyl-D-erythritol kinase [Chlamydiota bacterium]